MMHHFQKLTPVQKQFVRYTGVSLVAIALILFFIHGLSGVSFRGNKSAAFERKYTENANTALSNVWTAVSERTTFFEGANAVYEEETVFPNLVAETAPFRDALRDVLEERSLPANDPAVSPSIPNRPVVACEQALEQEQALLALYYTEIERIGVHPELYGVFMMLKEQSEMVVIPELEACAHSEE